MKRFRSMLAVVTAVSLLAGCASDSAPQPPQSATVPPSGGHHSPPPLPEPSVPPGTFDQARSHSDLAAARAALDRGNGADAKPLAASAVAHWPGDVAAWQALEDAARATKDDTQLRYALFFHDKADYAAELAPHAASLGFQTLAAEDIGTTHGGLVQDQKMTDMANIMAAFYDQQDKQKVLRDLPSTVGETPYFEEHPYYGMVLFGGVVAAVLTGAKEIR